MVHIIENAQFVGVHDDLTVADTSCRNPVIYRLSEETGQMMDTGANCCITNNLSCLVDVESIPPFAVGVAVSGTGGAVGVKIGVVIGVHLVL